MHVTIYIDRFVICVVNQLIELYMCKLQVKHGVGVKQIIEHVLGAWEVATGKKKH